MYRAEGARTRPCPAVQSEVAREAGSGVEGAGGGRGGDVMSHTAQCPVCRGTD